MRDLSAVRSLLFLPASNPRAIAKARQSAADLVILDLEDAVKPADKNAARSAAAEAVASPWPMLVAIRVNGRESPWHGDDLAMVREIPVPLVVMPRVAAADELATVAGQIERPVLAMIETAAGVLAAPSIAGEAAALIAGTNDLRADLRLPLDATREPISASLQWIVLAARASGIPAFDGVYNQLTDLEGFRRECESGRQLGFDGKSLIHPDQIDPCNRLFMPTPEEIAEAEALLEAFDGGAQRVGDRMVERMHVEAARRIIARARR